MKGKAEYIAAVLEEKGLETKTVLPEMAKKIILSLHFPKSMRWGDGSLHFARPISWILALFGAETVHFELDGIKSSNTDKGTQVPFSGCISGEGYHLIYEPARKQLCHP